MQPNTIKRVQLEQRKSRRGSVRADGRAETLGVGLHLHEDFYSKLSTKCFWRWSPITHSVTPLHRASDCHSRPTNAAQIQDYWSHFPIFLGTQTESSVNSCLPTKGHLMPPKFTSTASESELLAADNLSRYKLDIAHFSCIRRRCKRWQIPLCL